MNFDKEFTDNIINVTSNAAIACYEHLGKKDKILVDKAATDMMRKNLNNLSKRSIWFHRGGENANLRDLFSLSDFIFVTEDSAMMISESISSGKIVTTLFPEKVVTPERYKNHIDLYLNKGFIFRSKIGDQLVLRKNNDHSQKIEESRKKLLNQILCNIDLR